MDFLIAAGTEIDSHLAGTCINLSHLLNRHSKCPRFDSTFHFMCLFPEQVQAYNWEQREGASLDKWQGDLSCSSSAGLPLPTL